MRDAARKLLVTHEAEPIRIDAEWDEMVAGIRQYEESRAQTLEVINHLKAALRDVKKELFHTNNKKLAWKPEADMLPKAIRDKVAQWLSDTTKFLKTDTTRLIKIEVHWHSFLAAPSLYCIA